MTTQVLAPAKINLGLEVIRKREDGFHDIATVFQTVSVFDRLVFTPADADSVQVSNRFEQIEGNLVSRAIELGRAAGCVDGYWRVDLHKRIPLAAGMGGASADAAATLLSLCEGGDARALSELALQLGSDVPFLLHGGAALGSGRGERLDPLPSLRRCWIVLCAPAIELERKTARLYGALRGEDFSDGSRVERVAEALRRGQQPDPAALGNAFARPLAEILPEIERLRLAMLKAGAPFVALSGAGPTHYTMVGSLAEAVAIAQRLGKRRPAPMRILIARPVGAGLLGMARKTIVAGQTL